MAFIRFANGATISLEASWALNVCSPHYTNLLAAGTKGGIQRNPLTLVQEQGGMLTTTTPQITPWDEIEPFEEEIAAFAQAIRTGGPSPVPGEQALITQRILDGVYKSGQKGKEVKV